MFTADHSLAIACRMGRQALSCLAGAGWRRALDDAAARRAAPRGVPTRFLGLCVAAAPDPAGDDYILARLRELGLRDVRLDFSLADRQGYTERFLNRLLADGFRVCLHLVQPRSDARLMGREAGAAERWTAFTGEVMDQYGQRLELIEVGSTCNRRSWSGYSPASFRLAWQIAWEQARGRSLTLAGPNVTDFEPVYNAGWLGELRRAGMPPSVHTDNLFVERATEPEAYDPKVGGRRLAGVLRFDLVRKARLLRAIGQWAGVPRLICPHVAWSLRRIGRFLDDVEGKQADYLARYLLLAAVSGALERVYWGPLIGQREGLIDDGTSEYPELPHVTYYGQARGALAQYRVRPAFHALAALSRWLPGAVYQGSHPGGQGLELVAFDLPGPGGRARRLHAVWTVNGRVAPLDALYTPDDLARAEALDRSGARLARAPRMACESPVYLVWPDAESAPAPTGRRPLAGLRFARRPDWDFARLDPAWTAASGLAGVYLATAGADCPDGRALLELVRAPRPDASSVLRAARNRVWTAPAPWDAGRRLVVKAFPPGAWLRRALDRGKPCKAVRSWNGAQELLRRGLPTPRPVACLYPAPGPRRARGPSYYLCDAFENAQSARDAFTAFSAGADAWCALPAHAVYDALAAFAHGLHERGVFFRDLSAGNLLLRPTPDGALEFALIDTARARFYGRRLGLRRRLCDLMRLCHPLHDAGRRTFLPRYLAHGGRPFRSWMLLPFRYYDAKHRLKNAWKRLRGKR